MIIGAGPAGLCAALRLQQLDYRVLVIERSLWPRPQIGEALTPGVKNIIDMLDANDALRQVPHLARQPTSIIWRSNTAEMVRHHDSAIVERSAFDAALLNLAQQRGVTILQPAQMQALDGMAGDWRVHIALSADAAVQPAQVSARYILDASGRHGSAMHRIACAPRLLALWAHSDALPCCATQVEALPNGWLWGARLPDGRYRLMWLSDPKQSELPVETRLRQACAVSTMFAAYANANYDGKIEACSATPYLDLQAWQAGRLKLGDAAFALDPISSSGVEKAMRFSLQAVVAIHTELQAKQPQKTSLAREFFIQSLAETCARHTFWTQNYYAQAWCAALDHPFWQSRTHFIPEFDTPAEAEERACAQAFRRELLHLQNHKPPAMQAMPTQGSMQQPIHFCQQLKIVSTPCVVDDQVQLQTALAHPHLKRPVAYLDGEHLVTHLAHFTQQHTTLAQMMSSLCQTMPLTKAQRILGWLWQHGLLRAA